MRVEIQNLQRSCRVDRERLRRLARFCLARVKRPRAILSVVLLDDRAIQNLHREFMAIDEPTDVLAFGMQEGRRLAGGDQILGDVAISVDHAARYAKRRGVPPQKEVELYLAHGILHLVGYEDHKAGERRQMEARQAKLLKEFEKRDPSATLRGHLRMTGSRGHLRMTG